MSSAVEAAALARANVDEDAVIVQTDAAMPVVVDDFRALEHADTVDQLLL